MNMPANTKHFREKATIAVGVDLTGIKSDAKTPAVEGAREHAKWTPVFHGNIASQVIVAIHGHGIEVVTALDGGLRHQLYWME